MKASRTAVSFCCWLRGSLEQPADFIQLDNIEFAAFTIAHEIGHRSGKLKPDGHDPLGALSVLNNGTIQRACFPEVTAVKGPPSP